MSSQGSTNDVFEKEDIENNLYGLSGIEYLTFVLANEEYGVDVQRVLEIRGWEPVSAIPNSPAYVLGVINLRGLIVPVVDLRIRFKLSNVEYCQTTVVIILSVLTEEGKDKVIGVVVDAISDVLEAKVEKIQSISNFDISVEMEYISGLISSGSGMVMLLDIDKMLDVRSFK